MPLVRVDRPTCFYPNPPGVAELNGSIAIFAKEVTRQNLAVGLGFSLLLIGSIALVAAAHPTPDA